MDGAPEEAIFDDCLWRERRKWTRGERAVMFGVWCQLQARLGRGRQAEDVGSLFETVFRDDGEVPLDEIVWLVSRLHAREVVEGSETHFVEHTRTAGMYGLGERALCALEGYVWARMWPQRLEREVSQSVVEDGVTSVSASEEALVRAWLRRTAQSGLPDGALERMQLALMCSVHTPLGVCARLDDRSTAYKRYRDFDAEMGRRGEFGEVVRRCVQTLPHQAVGTAPAADDALGRILDACGTLSILCVYVGTVLARDYALVETVGGEAKRMAVVTADGSGPEWCPVYGVYYDPGRGTYMRRKDGTLVALGKDAGGVAIAWNYVRLLREAFPDNERVKEVHAAMTDVADVRRRLGESVPDYL